MKQFIELADRVFSYEITPDTPGICRRTMTVEVESGPPLTREEYDRVTAAVVAEMVAAGSVVYGWGPTG